MDSGDCWWGRLITDLESNPVYLAERLALSVAMRVSDDLSAKGMARAELAKKLGVSKAYVSQLLNGHGNMTLLTLCKLSTCLELPLTVEIGHGTIAPGVAPVAECELPLEGAYSATQSVIQFPQSRTTRAPGAFPEEGTLGTTTCGNAYDAQG